MSLAPPTSLYLYSSHSHPLPKSHLSSFTQRSHPNLFPVRFLFHLSFSTSFSTLHSFKSSAFKIDIGLGDSHDAGQPREQYQVEQEQPHGLKFAPGASAHKTRLFTVGDKVITTRFFFPLPFHLFCSYSLPTPPFLFQFKLCFLNLAHHARVIKELTANLG